MTLADAPTRNRAAALAILALLIAAFWIGPVAAYRDLIDVGSDDIATKNALLQRYRALAGAEPTAAPTPPGPVLLYPDIPESQAIALLQETVKAAAAAAQIQVQGLQVLRSEALPGATRIGVRIRAAGDVANLRGLLYAIEAARPMLYPDNLQIQSLAASQGAAPSLLDFQLDISGFKTEPAS
jgi:general secretion pathway protein M